MWKKILAVVMFVSLAVASQAMAESIFNKASGCIANWGKPCEGKAKETVTKKEMKEPPATTQADVIGNKVPTGTVKEGAILSK